jgi:hypothetical protein
MIIKIYTEEQKMKLERKHKLGIAMGIGVLMILYGVLSAIFHFDFNPKTVNSVTTLLMFVALWMVLSLRTKKNGPEETDQKVNLINNPESDERCDLVQDTDITLKESNTADDNNVSSGTKDNIN